MSSAYATLRSIFPKISKPRIVKPVAAKTLVPKSITPPEKDKIPSFVKKFKENCDEPSFRDQLSLYKSAVRRLSISGKFHAVRDILEHQKQYPEIKDERFAVRLITLYGSAKMFDDAQRVFDELPSLDCERTIMSFNGLLSACLSSKKYEMVRELLNDLPDKLSIKPDIYSYNTLIKSLCEMGSLDSALLVLDEMSKNDIQHDVVTFNTLINAFCRGQRLSEADKIWALMEEKGVQPNSRTYNAMLRALVKDNRIQEASSLVQEMEKAKVEPDSFTYNAILKGFVDEGNMEEVKIWFKKMNEAECTPDLATFGMLIPFACDKGDFDYAYILCKAAMKNRGRVYKLVVQRVIDGLVERSMTEEANKLMKIGNSNGYKGFSLAGSNHKEEESS